MQVDGSCLCGAIQYRAEVDPKRVVLCHCSDCQINSGSSMSWLAVATPDSFQLLGGTPKTFIKTAESGRQRVLCFCSDCGTRICAQPVTGEVGPVTLRAGTIRQRGELRPRAHVWARSAQAWLDTLHTLPRIDTQP